MVLEDLQTFIAVAHTRSFSKAAQRLRVAQSSLSKRVQRLETDLGVALFLRHGRGVSLTESGTILLARADKLVREVQDIESDVRSATSEPVGPVRIAMPPVTAPVLAPLVFQDCRTHYPRISPHLRENTSDNIHEWLLSGDIDLALLYNPEDSADFVVHPLLSEPLYLIAPAFDKTTGQPIAYPASYGIDDLARLPLILPRSPHSIRILVERLCAGNGIQPDVRGESDSIRTTKGIVEIGLGCTIFSKGALAEEIAQGRLRAIPFKSPLLSWTLCLVHPRRDNLSLAIMAVKRIITVQVGTLLKRGFWPDARDLSA
ncbi:MAG TPA: LysR family transcriptional regulator [Acidovorax sp.]|nr:LysR family transcriptional regulator [Acidovorax sp.]